MTELEMLAITWAMKTMHLYTTGRLTQIITAHLPLEVLCSRPLVYIKNKRLLNLVGAIDQYGYKVTYIEGKRNLMADALSRNPVYYTDDEIKENMHELGLDHVHKMSASTEVPGNFSIYSASHKVSYTYLTIFN